MIVFFFNLTHTGKSLSMTSAIINVASLSRSMEFQLVLRQTPKSITGMKKARCDLENGENIVPTASKRQKTEDAIESPIPTMPKTPEMEKTALVIPPMPLSKRLRMEETSPVLTTFSFSSPSPIRSHPPSPLRFQISESSPAFQIPITPPSTPTQHKHRGRLSGPLLKQVLSPIVQPLPEFQFSEDEIEIVSTISTGTHSTVLRIVAGGKLYALKIHRYDRHAPTEEEDTTSYPRPNSYFTAECNVYANLISGPSIHGTTTPKCHGFINLTRIPTPPQSPDLPARGRFSSKNGSPALYRDYITHPDNPRRCMPSPIWRSYFKYAPAGSVILRGLVFTEVEPSHYINPKALADSRRELRVVVAKGTKALKALHASGVLHGDIEMADSVMLRDEGGKGGEQGKCGTKERTGFVFMGFGQAKTTRDYGPRMFRKAAKMEIRAWEGRWECMKVKGKAKCSERGQATREEDVVVGMAAEGGSMGLS